MVRDRHGNNAKIAIELILTKQPLQLALQGRGPPYCARQTEDAFGVRCRNQRGYLHIALPDDFARVQPYGRSGQE